MREGAVDRAIRTSDAPSGNWIEAGNGPHLTPSPRPSQCACALNGRGMLQPTVLEMSGVPAEPMQGEHEPAGGSTGDTPEVDPVGEPGPSHTAPETPGAMPGSDASNEDVLALLPKHTVSRDGRRWCQCPLCNDNRWWPVTAQQSHRVHFNAIYSYLHAGGAYHRKQQDQARVYRPASCC